MKLVWSPETAAKAFIDTVKHCDLFQESGEAELISATAAGWNAKFILETWSSQGPDISTSVGLAIASSHTGGKHTCIVPDEESKTKYLAAMGNAGKSTKIIILGELENNVLVGVDFLVMDCRVKEFARVLSVVKLGMQGAVLVCRNAFTNFKWRNVCDGSRRLVRSVLLPVGTGLEIAHIGAVGGGRSTSGHAQNGKSRWLRHFDSQSGEEHVIRKQ